MSQAEVLTFKKGRCFMKPLQVLTVAFVLTSLGGCVAYSQPPGYGYPSGSQPEYGGPSGSQPGYYGPDYRPEPTPRAEVGFFYDDLSPYGDWLFTRAYGWVWFPRDVPPYWRPYVDGRWVSTEYGWTWASNEPFGWATYHYGRWAWDARYGWLWVPGTVWGPAWVSWQYGNGYVGWAPLPPAVGFEVGVGIRLNGFNLSIDIRPDAYSFVPDRWFLAARLDTYLVPPARNITIIHHTTNVTNYIYVDNRVVNRGVEPRYIEQTTGHRIEQRHLTEVRERTRTEVGDRDVRLYRPDRQQLESVRIGTRTNQGIRTETPPQTRAQQQPPADRRGANQGTRPEAPPTTRSQRQPAARSQDSPAPVVAPRTQRVPQADAKQVAERERREKQDLERYQAAEARRIETLHRQELAKAPPKAGRDEVRQRQEAESKALKQEQRTAAQQLEARQKLQRQAAQAQAPPPARATTKAQEKKAGEQKANESKDNQKDTKRKKGKG